MTALHLAALATLDTLDRAHAAQDAARDTLDTLARVHGGDRANMKARDAVRAAHATLRRAARVLSVVGALACLATPAHADPTPAPACVVRALVQGSGVVRICIPAR